MNDDPETQIVNGLSALISKALRQHEEERQSPIRSADSMDHFIGESGARVTALRRIRADFENEMARSLELDPR